MKNKTGIPSFELWLEYNPRNESDPDLSGWNMQNNFCNIGIDLGDGRRYGINVWTYEYFTTAIAEDKASGEHLHGLYLRPPDLFVKDLHEDSIRAAISDLLEQGELEWLLNPSVFAIRCRHPWKDALDDIEQTGNLEKKLGILLTPGHPLHHEDWRLIAFRHDTREVAVKTRKGSIILLQFSEDYKSLLTSGTYANEIMFWELRLRDDIASSKNNR